MEKIKIKKKLTIYSILIILIFSNLSGLNFKFLQAENGDQSPPSILRVTQFPEVPTQFDGVVVYVEVEDETGFSSIYLMYERNNNLTSIPMKYLPNYYGNGTCFYASLPSFSAGTKITYFIEVTDSSENQNIAHSLKYDYVVVSDGIPKIQLLNEPKFLYLGDEYKFQFTIYDEDNISLQDTGIDPPLLYYRTERVEGTQQVVYNSTTGVFESVLPSVNLLDGEMSEGENIEVWVGAYDKSPAHQYGESKHLQLPVINEKPYIYGVDRYPYIPLYNESFNLTTTIYYRENIGMNITQVSATINRYDEVTQKITKQSYILTQSEYSKFVFTGIIEPIGYIDNIELKINCKYTSDYQIEEAEVEKQEKSFKVRDCEAPTILESGFSNGVSTLKEGEEVKIYANVLDRLNTKDVTAIITEEYKSGLQLIRSSKEYFQKLSYYGDDGISFIQQMSIDQSISGDFYFDGLVLKEEYVSKIRKEAASETLSIYAVEGKNELFIKIINPEGFIPLNYNQLVIQARAIGQDILLAGVYTDLGETVIWNETVGEYVYDNVLPIDKVFPIDEYGTACLYNLQNMEDITNAIWIKFVPAEGGNFSSSDGLSIDNIRLFSINTLNGERIDCYHQEINHDFVEYYGYYQATKVDQLITFYIQVSDGVNVQTQNNEETITVTDGRPPTFAIKQISGVDIGDIEINFSMAITDYSIIEPTDAVNVRFHYKINGLEEISVNLTVENNWDDKGKVWVYRLDTTTNLNFNDMWEYWFSAEDPCGNRGESKHYSFVVEENSAPTISLTCQTVTYNGEEKTVVDPAGAEIGISGEYLDINMDITENEGGSGIKLIQLYWYTSSHESNCWSSEVYSFMSSYSITNLTVAEKMIHNFDKVGILYYYAQVIDHAGNIYQTPEYQVQLIDNVNPIIKINSEYNSPNGLYNVDNSYGDISYNEDAYITLEIEDASTITNLILEAETSQGTFVGEVMWDEYYHDWTLQHYQIKINKAWEVGENINLKITAIDSFGNALNNVLLGTEYIVDKLPPVLLSYSDNNPELGGGEITISYQVKDIGSVVAYLYYNFNSSVETPSTENATLSDFQVAVMDLESIDNTKYSPYIEWSFTKTLSLPSGILYPAVSIYFVALDEYNNSLTCIGGKAYSLPNFDIETSIYTPRIESYKKLADKFGDFREYPRDKVDKRWVGETETTIISYDFSVEENFSINYAHPYGDRFAKSVLGFYTHYCQNSYYALGEPDGNMAEVTGSIRLDMGHEGIIVSKPGDGADFTVYGGSGQYQVLVFNSWFPMEEYHYLGTGTGITSWDLEDEGLDKARYVEIWSETVEDDIPVYIDAIEAIHCDGDSFTAQEWQNAEENNGIPANIEDKQLSMYYHGYNENNEILEITANPEFYDYLYLPLWMNTYLPQIKLSINFVQQPYSVDLFAVDNMARDTLMQNGSYVHLGKIDGSGVYYFACSYPNRYTGVLFKIRHNWARITSELVQMYNYEFTLDYIKLFGIFYRIEELSGPNYLEFEKMYEKNSGRNPDPLFLQMENYNGENQKSASIGNITEEIWYDAINELEVFYGTKGEWFYLAIDRASEKPNNSIVTDVQIVYVDGERLYWKSAYNNQKRVALIFDTLEFYETYGVSNYFYIMSNATIDGDGFTAYYYSFYSNNELLQGFNYEGIPQADFRTGDAFDPTLEDTSYDSPWWNNPLDFTSLHSDKHGCIVIQIQENQSGNLDHLNFEGYYSFLLDDLYLGGEELHENRIGYLPIHIEGFSYYNGIMNGFYITDDIHPKLRLQTSIENLYSHPLELKYVLPVAFIDYGEGWLPREIENYDNSYLANERYRWIEVEFHNKIQYDITELNNDSCTLWQKVFDSQSNEIYFEESYTHYKSKNVDNEFTKSFSHIIPESEAIFPSSYQYFTYRASLNYVGSISSSDYIQVDSPEFRIGNTKKEDSNINEQYERAKDGNRFYYFLPYESDTNSIAFVNISSKTIRFDDEACTPSNIIDKINIKARLSLDIGESIEKVSIYKIYAIDIENKEHVLYLSNDDEYYFDYTSDLNYEIELNISADSAYFYIIKEFKVEFKIKTFTASAQDVVEICFAELKVITDEFLPYDVTYPKDTSPPSINLIPVSPLSLENSTWTFLYSAEDYSGLKNNQFQYRIKYDWGGIDDQGIVYTKSDSYSEYMVFNLGDIFNIYSPSPQIEGDVTYYAKRIWIEIYAVDGSIWENEYIYEKTWQIDDGINPWIEQQFNYLIVQMYNNSQLIWTEAKDIAGVNTVELIIENIEDFHHNIYQINDIYTLNKISNRWYLGDDLTPFSFYKYGEEKIIPYKVNYYYTIHAEDGKVWDSDIFTLQYKDGIAPSYYTHSIEAYTDAEDVIIEIWTYDEIFTSDELNVSAEYCQSIYENFEWTNNGSIYYESFSLQTDGEIIHNEETYYRYKLVIPHDRIEAGYGIVGKIIVSDLASTPNVFTIPIEIQLYDSRIVLGTPHLTPTPDQNGYVHFLSDLSLSVIIIESYYPTPVVWADVYVNDDYSTTLNLATGDYVTYVYGSFGYNTIGATLQDEVRLELHASATINSETVNEEEVRIIDFVYWDLVPPEITYVSSIPARMNPAEFTFKVKEDIRTIIPGLITVEYSLSNQNNWNPCSVDYTESVGNGEWLVNASFDSSSMSAGEIYDFKITVTDYYSVTSLTVNRSLTDITAPTVLFTSPSTPGYSQDITVEAVLVDDSEVDIDNVYINYKNENGEWVYSTDFSIEQKMSYDTNTNSFHFTLESENHQAPYSMLIKIWCQDEYSNSHWSEFTISLEDDTPPLIMNDEVLVNIDNINAITAVADTEIVLRARDAWSEIRETEVQVYKEVSADSWELIAVILLSPDSSRDEGIFKGYSGILNKETLEINNVVTGTRLKFIPWVVDDKENEADTLEIVKTVVEGKPEINTVNMNPSPSSYLPYDSIVNVEVNTTCIYGVEQVKLDIYIDDVLKITDHSFTFDSGTNTWKTVLPDLSQYARKNVKLMIYSYTTPPGENSLSSSPEIIEYYLKDVYAPVYLENNIPLLFAEQSDNKVWFAVYEDITILAETNIAVKFKKHGIISTYYATIDSITNYYDGDSKKYKIEATLDDLINFSAGENIDIILEVTDDEGNLLSQTFDGSYGTGITLIESDPPTITVESSFTSSQEVGVDYEIGYNEDLIFDFSLDDASGVDVGSVTYSYTIIDPSSSFSPSGTNPFSFTIGTTNYDYNALITININAQDIHGFGSSFLYRFRTIDNVLPSDIVFTTGLSSTIEVDSPYSFSFRGIDEISTNQNMECKYRLSYDEGSTWTSYTVLDTSSYDSANDEWDVTIGAYSDLRTVTVEVVVTDQSANSRSETFSYTVIDTLVPDITWDNAPTSYGDNSDLWVSAFITDNIAVDESSIDFYYVKEGDSTVYHLSYETDPLLTTLYKAKIPNSALSWQDVVTYYVYAEDTSGNSLEISKTVTINIDEKKPIINYFDYGAENTFYYYDYSVDVLKDSWDFEDDTDGWADAGIYSSQRYVNEYGNLIVKVDSGTRYYFGTYYYEYNHPINMVDTSYRVFRISWRVSRVPSGASVRMCVGVSSSGNGENFWDHDTWRYSSWYSDTNWHTSIFYFDSFDSSTDGRNIQKIRLHVASSSSSATFTPSTDYWACQYINLYAHENKPSFDRSGAIYVTVDDNTDLSSVKAYVKRSDQSTWQGGWTLTNYMTNRWYIYANEMYFIWYSSSSWYDIKVVATDSNSNTETVTFTQKIQTLDMRWPSITSISSDDYNIYNDEYCYITVNTYDPGDPWNGDKGASRIYYSTNVDFYYKASSQSYWTYFSTNYFSESGKYANAKFTAASSFPDQDIQFKAIVTDRAGNSITSSVITVHVTKRHNAPTVISRWDSGYDETKANDYFYARAHITCDTDDISSVDIRYGPSTSSYTTLTGGASKYSGDLRDGYWQRGLYGGDTIGERVYFSFRAKSVAGITGSWSSWDYVEYKGILLSQELYSVDDTIYEKKDNRLYVIFRNSFSSENYSVFLNLYVENCSLPLSLFHENDEERNVYSAYIKNVIDKYQLNVLTYTISIRDFFKVIYTSHNFTLSVGDISQPIIEEIKVNSFYEYGTPISITSVVSDKHMDKVELELLEVDEYNEWRVYERISMEDALTYYFVSFKAMHIPGYYIRIKASDKSFNVAYSSILRVHVGGKENKHSPSYLNQALILSFSLFIGSLTFIRKRTFSNKEFYSLKFFRIRKKQFRRR